MADNKDSNQRAEGAVSGEETVGPLVSVVIPCYNHGHYLPEAIESVLAQTYPHVEVVVVDDGSTDNTAEVAAAYPQVKYVYKENGGLSSARNTGIDRSSGGLLVFLDADDWLFKNGIETNVRYLQQHPEAAFVSGAFDAAHLDENIVKEYIRYADTAHYVRLLEGNYVGMVAAVMFRRLVFQEFRFDCSLKSCEDYDLYLRIAREHPVFHHQEKIAVYQIHDSNMSSNLPRMLEVALAVLAKQKQNIRSEQERAAYKSGEAYWKSFYCGMLYDKLYWGNAPVTKRAILTLLKHQPALGLRIITQKTKKKMKAKIKDKIPSFFLKSLGRAGFYKHYQPAVGNVSMGDLNRTAPLSEYFGYDRGGAIDRYYIENFLTRESASINGRVLEIADNYYTTHFGGDKVQKSDILHINDSNKAATIIGDISNAPHIPDNTFDCFIFTQTLQFIYNFKEALHTCHRILKPGGTLLLTVPYITPIDHDEWKDVWYWSFTDKAMKKLMAESFPGGEVEINTFGNVFAATTFLYGMGLAEVQKDKLDYQDEHYQVIITVKAVKK